MQLAVNIIYTSKIKQLSKLQHGKAKKKQQQKNKYKSVISKGKQFRVSPGFTSAKNIKYVHLLVIFMIIDNNNDNNIAFFKVGFA